MCDQVLVPSVLTIIEEATTTHSHIPYQCTPPGVCCLSSLLHQNKTDTSASEQIDDSEKFHDKQILRDVRESFGKRKKKVEL